jgi:hypothetical protein
MRLGDQDRADIQTYIDVAREQLAVQGLSLEVDRDMAAFKDFYNAQPARLNFPTSLDADHCIIPPNAFWLKVRAHSGEIVACHGQKPFETEDFVEALRLHLCYRNAVPALDLYDVDLKPEVLDIQIAGRIVLGGGLWVHPDWRGRGLMIFNRVNRALALRHFLPDYFVGWLDYRPSRLHMATARDGAAYHHAVRLSDDLYPPTVYIGKEAKPRPMLLAWSTWREWLDTIRDELAETAAVAGGDRHTRSTPPVPADRTADTSA